ncbi:MAG: MgtC/SapB family protein [bacterium]
MEWNIALVWIERLLAAVVAGAMIGLERELRGKPAGLRTIVLITMGSAMFMIGSEIITIGPRFTDSSRVAAQIVSGVGFLGAGAIITSRNKVLGLTTAATIWIAAAIGLVIGYGEVGFGLFTSMVTVSVLIFLTQLEKRFLHPWARRHGFIHVNGRSDSPHPSGMGGSGDYPQSIE